MTTNTPGLAVARVAEKIGSQAALARALDVAPPTVNQWISGVRPVPKNLVLKIEAIGGGVATRRDLRPDDWHLIWPELATTQELTQPSTQEVGNA